MSDKPLVSIDFLTHLSKIEGENISESIVAILELFQALDEIENLNEEEFVHPTSKFLRIKYFNQPLNVRRDELFRNVPKTLSSYIVAPLVITDDT